ncbi:cell wall-binding repeat-containing protein [Raoultibacter phocaeensis]|uniref:cell wall-binding repeat-containing protein n=1 Tax=Raoultibacter phocaeensis TaxID=2479841 RepID=UPI0015D62CF7|nr:cell wall-binding repeat-containing protein [Raoultibacter phocaeensis]
MEASKGLRSPLAVLLALTLALGGSFSTIPAAYADPSADPPEGSIQQNATETDTGENASDGETGAPASEGTEGSNSQPEGGGTQEDSSNGSANAGAEGEAAPLAATEELEADEADGIDLLAVDPLGDIAVDTVDDLIDAVENAGENRTITLSASLAADMAGKNATIALNNANGYELVIDGGSQTLASAGANRFFSAANPNGGSITFKNMTLSGSGAGVTASGSAAGVVVLDNVTITGHAGAQAVGVASGTVEIKNSAITNGSRAIEGTSGNAKSIIVTNTLLKANRGDRGAALLPGANTTVTLTGCTINDNVGTSGGGYAGGAISVDQMSNVVLTVKQCYFEGNQAPMAGTFGGCGGAIAVYHSDQCKLTVVDSYFKGNMATANQTVRNDGGAISVFMNAAERSAEATIDNCVFEGNIANDDGGALLIEGVSSGSASINVNATIRNSTFVENEGKQLSTGVAGGAVQIYSKARVGFENCTFYNNVAGNGAGGAIGLSGSLAGGFLPVRPTVTVENCLFAENTGTKGTNVNNVAGWGGSGSSGFTNSGGNIGFDAGTALPTGFSAQTVFGTAAPTLQVNGCSTQVGLSSDGMVLPSLYIAPVLDSTAGLYADAAATANATAQDKRYVSRHVTKPDSGAVDIGWIRLHPNGGTWDSAVVGDYDTTRMVSASDGAGSEYTYIACDTGSNIALPGDAMFSAVPTDATLLGWGSTPTTQPGDADFHAIGDSVLGCEGDTCSVYYAVWGAPEPPEPETSLNVARLYGADRYGTSRQVSTYEREAADEDIVILASGNDYHFPDALTASSLSGYLDNAPIVLTDYSYLKEDARAAIEDELQAKHVIIIGDKYAVSDEVAAQVAALSTVEIVDRIGGVDRQETAEFIFEEIQGSASKTAIIARCNDFPDSLTISPYAAVTLSPIFLTEFGLDTLTDETKAALAAGGFERILVLGDEYAVSANAQEEARVAAGLSDSQVIRIGGDHRYETASMIAEWTTSSDREASEQLNWEKPAIARGDLHPDSLTGGALQGRDRSVILLTPTNEVGPEAHPLIAAQDGTVTEIRFFGDEYAIAHHVIKGFVNALTYDTIVWRPDDSVQIDLS